MIVAIGGSLPRAILKVPHRRPYYRSETSRRRIRILSETAWLERKEKADNNGVDQKKELVIS
jgi:hypothetical protein